MILIKNMKLSIGDRRTEGDPIGRSDALDRRPDCGFGRPIHVPKFAASRQ